MTPEKTSKSIWFKAVSVFIIYTIIALVSSTRAILGYIQHGTLFNAGAHFSSNFIDWYVWALLTPLMIWSAGKFSLNKGTALAVFLKHFPVYILCTTIYVILVQFAYELNKSVVNIPETPPLFVYNFISCIAIFGAISAYTYYQKSKEREIKAAEARLEAKLAQAQLQVLKMQIHPHFLFNTLHTISSLIHEDTEAADTMLSQLSDLLRITMENAGEQKIILQKELEFLKPYLEIEKTRFHDRLKIQVRVADNALTVKVPHLILQPIVENSIKHGIMPKLSGGQIDITGEVDNGMLIIKVSDNGQGIQKKTIKKGIGISNTEERLKQLYGNKYSLSIENKDDGGVLAEIRIPVEN